MMNAREATTHLVNAHNDNARILMADDHQLFMAGLHSLLDGEPDLEVVETVKNGREAVRRTRELSPDLAILDIEMPHLNGIEATRQITADLETRVLCLSMHSTSSFVEGALAAGASGYLVKDSEPAELLRAVRTVLEGRTYLSPAVAGTVVDALKAERPLGRDTAFAVLTDKEREVLQLLAEGYSTREIAEKLFVSPKTIHTHREHVMEKLRIRSIAGLTKYAIREGLTSLDPAPASET